MQPMRSCTDPHANSGIVEDPESIAPRTSDIKFGVYKGVVDEFEYEDEWEEESSFNGKDVDGKQNDDWRYTDGGGTDGTVRVFREDFSLEFAIGPHACSLEVKRARV
jgi:hypothetical protein